MVQDIRRVLVVEKNWHFKESNDHDSTELSRFIGWGKSLWQSNIKQQPTPQKTNMSHGCTVTVVIFYEGAIINLNLYGR